MEKASTPRNRLTRSSAKQVNAPKNEQEESLDTSSAEEVKHNVRKKRRRYDVKAKTNGDTTNIEDKINNEETMIEENKSDGSNPEDLDLNNKSEDSPKSISQKTPSPTVSRKSLRPRRSSTPGPELESSASKKMKRSSSFGKLDMDSTPTNRRGRRAKSESKDFVFTPTKEKQSCSDDSSGKYIPNATLRIIEKIDEVNEEEKLSEDERETKALKENSSSSQASENTDKIIDSIGNNENIEQTELKLISEISVKDMELSVDSKTEVMKPTVNDSSCGIVSIEDRIPDISQNTDTFVHSSELLNDNTTKVNETEEANFQKEIEKSESKLEPCLLSTETGISEITTNVSETSDPSETGSLPKETFQLDELQSEDIVNELSNKSIEKNVQESVIEAEINKNTDSETTIEMDEIIQNNTMETIKKDEEKNMDIDLVNDGEVSLEKLNDEQQSIINDMEECDDSSKIGTLNGKSDIQIKPITPDDNDDEVSFKKINDELQSIIDEGMEESDDCSEIVTLNGKSDVQMKQKIPDDNENSEISKIDLINSSDSEDGIVEVKSNNSVLTECKDNDYENANKAIKSASTENEIIIRRRIEKNDQCKNGSQIELIESETVEENISYSVNQKDPQITGLEVSDICPYQDKVVGTDSNAETVPGQCGVDSLEEDLANNTEEIETLQFVDTEPSKPVNILIENPHTIACDEYIQATEAQEKFCHNSNQCSNLDEVQNLDNKSELLQEVNDDFSNRSNEKDTYYSETEVDKNDKPQSVENYDEEKYNEENFNENCEEEELIKSEEGSCDIYEGLSDSASYGDDKGEGSQFDESVLSESDTGNSDKSSVVEKEDMEEKARLINQICGSIDLKTKELILSKEGEKPRAKNPESPMTYEKALAIINKNRVKKIDDEEFFDMFTEELNKVSEKSGSDSDIAIVDEYLMEPVEPAKKNQPKSGTVQNAKQPLRPNGPALTNQPMPPEKYPDSYHQPVHGQHGHPIPTQPNNQSMQRVNFPQGAMYPQYDQNMHIRSQLMYNQYGHPSTSMQDPHMFNHPVPHPDVNFSTGMFNQPHPLCPVSESSYPSNVTLKIRTATDLNNTQSSSHKIYSNSDLTPLNVPLEERTFEHQENTNKYVNINSSAVAEAHKRDAGSPKAFNSDTVKSVEFSPEKADKSRTPILDLLGLDEKALKLLKKVLGLNSIRRQLMRRDLEWQKKCLEKNIWKSELRQRGKKKETRYRNYGQNKNLEKSLRAARNRNSIYMESDSTSLTSSSEEISEESFVTSSSFSEKSCSESESDSRKVDIEDKNVYVTLKTKTKPRYENQKDLVNLKKARLRSKKSPEPATEKKTKFQRKTREKMAQKQPVVVKSQCGTFTVDPLTASSQSSESEVQSCDDQHQVQEFKGKMKRDLASGRNKLSNMFAQNSFKKTKESRKKAVETFEEIKGPLRIENLKQSRKLPAEVLETLAKEDKRKKRLRGMDSGSDDSLERPKKIRKKSQKIRVKSKAADQNYIPCVTGGATEFSLRRLDKDGNMTLAEKAAKFRTDHLYGSTVKRITILDFKHQWC